MSRPLNKYEIVRAQWTYELRHSKFQQCFNAYFHFNERTYQLEGNCATGVLVRIVDREAPFNMTGGHIHKALTAAALPYSEWKNIQGMNDQGVSFSKIADHIDKVGYYVWESE